MKRLSVITDMGGETEVFYDPETKTFVWTCITGCAHEGIYREYFHISKAETIEKASVIIRKAEAGEPVYLATALPVAEIEALEESPDWETAPLPPEEQLY